MVIKMNFFNNIRLYLKDPNTGLLSIKFICKHCGEEIDENEPFNYYIPCTQTVCKYHEATFVCHKCYVKNKSIQKGDIS